MSRARNRRRRRPTAPPGPAPRATADPRPGVSMRTVGARSGVTVTGMSRASERAGPLDREVAAVGRHDLGSPLRRGRRQQHARTEADRPRAAAFAVPTVDAAARNDVERCGIRQPTLRQSGVRRWRDGDRHTQGGRLGRRLAAARGCVDGGDETSPAGWRERHGRRSRRVPPRRATTGRFRSARSQRGPRARGSCAAPSTTRRRTHGAVPAGVPISSRAVKTTLRLSGNARSTSTAAADASRRERRSQARHSRRRSARTSAPTSERRTARQTEQTQRDDRGGAVRIPTAAARTRSSRRIRRSIVSRNPVTSRSADGCLRRHRAPRSAAASTTAAATARRASSTSAIAHSHRASEPSSDPPDLAIDRGRRAATSLPAWQGPREESPDRAGYSRRRRRSSIARAAAAPNRLSIGAPTCITSSSAPRGPGVPVVRHPDRRRSGATRSEADSSDRGALAAARCSAASDRSRNRIWSIHRGVSAAKGPDAFPGRPLAEGERNRLISRRRRRAGHGERPPQPLDAGRPGSSPTTRAPRSSPSTVLRVTLVVGPMSRTSCAAVGSSGSRQWPDALDRTRTDGGARPAPAAAPTLGGSCATVDSVERAGP